MWSHIVMKDKIISVSLNVRVCITKVHIPQREINEKHLIYLFIYFLQSCWITVVCVKIEVKMWEHEWPMT